MAKGWRPARVTIRTVGEVLGRFGRVLDRWVIRAGEDSVPLPAVVRDYLAAWLNERPTGQGPRLWTDRTGLRAVTSVDVARLANRCAARAGYGDTITAAQVARAARQLTARGVPVDLPTLDELRRLAPAPEQLALPDDPDGYDDSGVDGQQALIPLPDNVVRIPRVPRRRGRRRPYAVSTVPGVTGAREPNGRPKYLQGARPIARTAARASPRSTTGGVVSRRGRASGRPRGPWGQGVAQSAPRERTVRGRGRPRDRRRTVTARTRR